MNVGKLRPPVLAAFGLIVSGTLAFGQSGERTIATAQTKHSRVAFTNRSGTFNAGSTSFCISILDRGTRSPVRAENVTVAFRQQVGRIQERPISAEVKLSAVGRYCGEINLGRQFYFPATYYVIVRYSDPVHGKNKARLYIAVR